VADSGFRISKADCLSPQGCSYTISRCRFILFKGAKSEPLGSTSRLHLPQYEVEQTGTSGSRLRRFQADIFRSRAKIFRNQWSWRICRGSYMRAVSRGYQFWYFRPWPCAETTGYRAVRNFRPLLNYWLESQRRVIPASASMPLLDTAQHEPVAYRFTGNAG